jgi:nucleoside-diphosphate-sugar epimerase
MGERVLVTGAAGFLGRHLIATLVAAGSPTVALCRDPTALAALASPALEVTTANVRDAEACARMLRGVDTVFHLAAVRHRPGSNPEEMIAVNERATVRLARQAAEGGADRFIHVGSAQAWGPSSVPLDEEAPLVADGAVSLYAESRARAMLQLRALAAEGVPVVTLAPTIVFGPDHPSRPNRVTSHMRRVLRRGWDIVIAGGEAPRDLVHVDDVVTALLAAARTPAAVGKELLLTGEPVSQHGLARMVSAAAGRRPPRLLSLPFPAAQAAARLLDGVRGYDPRCGWTSSVATLAQSWTFRGDRAREVLGHQPRPLAQGVAETVASIRRGAAS